MYLDSISDGILKGLDQQKFSFKTAISDSVFRIILILLIVPKTGLKGFIGIMFFSNFYTCILNVTRLIKITKVKINFIKEIFLPFLSANFSVFLVNFFIRGFSGENSLVYIILLCLISIPFYIVLLFSFGSLKKQEITQIIKR